MRLWEVADRNIADEIGLGGRKSTPRSNIEKNSGASQPPLPHSTTHHMMMNEALGSCRSEHRRRDRLGRTKEHPKEQHRKEFRRKPAPTSPFDYASHDDE